MVAIVRKLNPDERPLPLSYIDKEAERLRKERADLIKNAARKHQMAETALANAKAAEAAARREKEDAYHQLRELMRGTSKTVIGDLLITVNDTGGVNIETVSVL